MNHEKYNLQLLSFALLSVILIEYLTIASIREFEFNSMISIGCARILDIIVILFLIKTFAHNYDSIGLNQKLILPGLKSGTVWSLIFGIIVLIIYIVLSVFNYNPISLFRIKMPGTPFDICIFLIVGGIIGPVAEELLFRGIIYSYLRRWGIIAALTISTIIFVLLHFHKSGIPVTQVVGGILFALSYEKTNSIISPIIIHVSANLTIFSISLIY